MVEKNKLALYETDGQLFTTDVSAKCKVMSDKTRTDIKNPTQSNLDNVA